MTATPNNEAGGKLLTNLQLLQSIASEAYDEWDNDNASRVGKILRALADPVFAKSYRADIAELHASLTPAPSARDADVVVWQGRRIDPEEGPGLWWNIDASQVDLARRTGYEVRALYRTPPASVPVAELVALAEKWRAATEAKDEDGMYWQGHSQRMHMKRAADELTALAQEAK